MFSVLYHLLFLTFLATHILQFKMFDSISLQHVRNITEIKTIHNPRQKKWSP